MPLQAALTIHKHFSQWLTWTVNRRAIDWPGLLLIAHTLLPHLAKLKSLEKAYHSYRHHVAIERRTKAIG